MVVALDLDTIFTHVDEDRLKGRQMFIIPFPDEFDRT